MTCHSGIDKRAENYTAFDESAVRCVWKLMQVSTNEDAEIEPQIQYALPLLMTPTGFPDSFFPPKGEFLDFDLNN